MHNSVLIERVLYHGMQCTRRTTSYPPINPILVQSMNRFFPAVCSPLFALYCVLAFFGLHRMHALPLHNPLLLPLSGFRCRRWCMKAHNSRPHEFATERGANSFMPTTAVEYSSLVQGHPRIKQPQITKHSGTTLSIKNTH